ncbi:uncharacterized protein [Drosophila suzukii]|uniref:Uncharacterized protein n=1 Tax=Drosophila suzukii TaxID=28584 RepID=A0ABM4TXH1_DROSZ
MIDTRLSYKEHLEYANKKAAATARSLARILLNTRGPKQERRKLIASVVTSQVLYAAPVWAKAATTPSYMSSVVRTHRLCAKRISCAFRTISEEAALVIADLVPEQELVREAVEVEETVTTTDDQTRREARWPTRKKSISRWDSATSGHWTHDLIPVLSPWLERRHGRVDFYLTQILSGH